jgi:hypothetical protein
MHPIARFTRLSVTDVVGKHNEIPIGVKQLTGTKQNIGKLWGKKLEPGASGAMQDEHGVRHFPAAVVLGFAEGRIVQPQFRNSFACIEVKVVAQVIAFDGRRLRSWLRRLR